MCVMIMSYSKEDIYQRIADVLVEQFEVAAGDVSLEAKLYEDLDIDSIDAVNLMIELKSFTVQKVGLNDFKEVSTIGDVVDAVYSVVQQESQSNQQ